MSNAHDIIAVKIDVKKLLKEHFFQGKGTALYADLILIPTPTSAYNDSHMVCQSLPKELRDQGQKGPIVGNAKILKSGGGKPQQRRPEPTERQQANQDDTGADQDVPF